MGIAGRIAKAWLNSRLTPLIAIASLGLGALGVIGTPREEEPQISVPMIDVMAMLPGADPIEVEQQLVRPISQRMREIPGVEYTYGHSSPGMGMVTVRFAVGEDLNRSTTEVHAKLMAAMAEVPPGTPQPIVVPHGIDDVPILTLTFHGGGLDADQLRRVVRELEDQVRTVPEVARTMVTGGEAPTIRVQLDATRMAASGVTPGEVAQALQSANARMQAGSITSGGTEWLVEVGAPITTASDAARVVVSSRTGVPVYLGSIATVTEGSQERTSYVEQVSAASSEAAVTLSVSKRPGANATHVNRSILKVVDHARSTVIPEMVEMEITRDYGETAAHKASELILHLLIATLSVTVLIWLFLGFREALVVLVAVPVTLALTLFTYYVLGYTLNRITLFALIFSIGILVDDAIVVVENIYRHLKMRDHRSPEQAAIEGVDEVGNPTILATFTVIAAILPMAFVSGMMGPYMRPIPIGASAAMLASLGVAFIVTPYLALRLLRNHAGKHDTSHKASHKTSHKESREAPYEVSRDQVSADGSLADDNHGAAGGIPQGMAWYARLMGALIESRTRRRAVYAGTILLLVAASGLLAVKLVQVKMLPFDNKNEFQVILDLPEGTTLERTHAAARDIAVALHTVPEVTSTQVYSGIAAPFNFNGLVRHYFLRQGPAVADIQVNLAPRSERKRQSHAIAVAARPLVDSVARHYGARAKIAEIPPGPPVLSTLVAEVYAPDDSTRYEAASKVLAVMEATPGVVDVDWSVSDAQGRYSFRVDRATAGAAGVTVSQISSVLAIALKGAPVSQAVRPLAAEPVLITARLPQEQRSSVGALLAIPVATPTGPAPLGRFVHVDSTSRVSDREQKNLRPAIYVTADVAGSIESPVYAILAMNQALDTVRVNGAEIARYNAIQPETLNEVALKWDGEWQVTIEVFRDLGIAFAIVLVLIYILVVGWFQSYMIPLVIMAPIPLTLVGILPGHAVTGAFFTATSMIGMIALAGIIVRNSILLVDFIQLAEERGTPLATAVIESGVVRFRPIALTAAALIAGGLVMVLDPIFQGLAVALISGAVAATGLTMVIVPLLYWELRKRQKVGGVTI